VSRAELSYLLPLFELTEAMVGDEEQENVSFGLGEPAQSSQLTGDDADMGGFYVSYAVNGAIAAALDHAITLKLLVTKAGAVTNAAPWTLLRGVLEPASVAARIIVGSRRAIRRERALRFWHHDMTERAKWEADTGHVVNPPGKDGRTRAGEIVQIAKTLSLRENQVVTPLSYSDAVAHAGEAAGWPRPKRPGALAGVFRLRSRSRLAVWDTAPRSTMSSRFVVAIRSASCLRRNITRRAPS
jgi:hypothetical protein